MQLINRFWNDEAGFVVSAELVLIATVLVIGMLTGLATVREAVVQELGDVANAIGIINQSFSYSGITSHNSSTAGSSLVDQYDQCEKDQNNNNGAGNEPLCMDVEVAGPEGEQ